MKLKPEDAAKAIEFLGVDAENLDEFKAKFADSFVNKSRIEQFVRDEPEGKIMKALTGGIVGKVGDKLEALAKEFEIDTKGEEFKDVVHIQDRIAKVGELITHKKKAEIESLKSQISGDAGKATKEWEDKYAKLEKKYTETTGLLDTTKKEFDGFKEQIVVKEKKDKINKYWEESVSKIKFSNTVKPLEKKGLYTEFNDKYGMDIDEKGEPFVFSRDDNKRIPSTINAASFATAQELLEKEAKEQKLLDMTPSNGVKPTITSMFPQTPQTPADSTNGPLPGTRPISSAAKRLAETGKL